MMDAALAELARNCLAATHAGGMSFPDMVGQLGAAGFEGYAVDYRRNAQTFYLAGGDCLDLALPHRSGPVGDCFDAAAIEAQIRWAQSGGPDYSYTAFSRKVTAAGCAGYLVSFSGRRVVYYGRNAENHVELFPQ